MKRAKTESLFPKLGIGLGLRSDHYDSILNGRPKVEWFEAISENYLDDGGRPLHYLTKVREEHPVVLHGVSLSIASVDPLNLEYLKSLKRLIYRIEPSVVSDHCCWTGFNKQNIHDLMPVPFTEEAVNHIADRVLKVQEILGRRIMLENVSSYISFKYSEMKEWEFLSAIATKADCGLLLDVNNVYVSSINHRFNPMDFIKGVPAERIGQIHLAGHSPTEAEDGTTYLIDTHDAPVCDEVWALYKATVQELGEVNTMIEWDANIPSFERLESEAMKARSIQEAVRAERKTVA